MRLEEITGRRAKSGEAHDWQHERTNAANPDEGDGEKGDAQGALRLRVHGSGEGY